MQEKITQISVHYPGTLNADKTFCFTLPCAMTLLEVSAVGSNTNNATLAVGNTTTAAAYLAAFSIGDSNVPVVKTGADQVDGIAMHLADNTVFLLTLDFDGASGTAAADVTIVVTFLTG